MTSARRAFFLLLVGMILSAVSLACGLGAAAPVQSAAQVSSQQTEIAQINTPVAELSTPTAEEFPLIIGGQPTSAPTVAPQPAIPESRRLTLEYPPNIRVGDLDVIRLTSKWIRLATSRRRLKCREILSAGRSCKFQMYTIRTMFLQKHDWILPGRMFDHPIFRASPDSRSACNILLERSTDKRGNVSRNGLVLFAFRG